MKDEEVAEIIQLTEFETKKFEKFSMTTLMGWFPNFDELGRPLNCDPNRRWLLFPYKNTHVRVERKGYDVKIYLKEETFKTENNEEMLSSAKFDLIAELNLTPAYLIDK